MNPQVDWFGAFCLAVALLIAHVRLQERAVKRAMQREKEA